MAFTDWVKSTPQRPALDTRDPNPTAQLHFRGVLQAEEGAGGDRVR